MSINDPLLVDSRSAAQLLGVSERTLYTLRKDGLPYISMRGRIMFSMDDLEAWIDKNRQVDTDQEAA